MAGLCPATSAIVLAMEEGILITQLNDFIFCPASIYYHHLYEQTNIYLYQNTAQVKGTNAHKTIEEDHYSTRTELLQGISVYCDEYHLFGKIDLFDVKKGALMERKNTIKTIYDGYVFQLYGQYFALLEMGYQVNSLKLHSKSDNRSYPIKLPGDDPDMFSKFTAVLDAMNHFRLDDFQPENIEKCRNCIYESACGVSLL
jgi:CRISPR-associated protein Cas4